VDVDVQLLEEVLVDARSRAALADVAERAA
jgi:hypothetical protein